MRTGGPRRKRTRDPVTSGRQIGTGSDCRSRPMRPSRFEPKSGGPRARSQVVRFEPATSVLDGLPRLHWGVIVRFCAVVRFPRVASVAISNDGGHCSADRFVRLGCPPFEVKKPTCRRRAEGAIGRSRSELAPLFGAVSTNVPVRKVDCHEDTIRIKDIVAERRSADKSEARV
jgi:hypothetical protein